MEPDPAGCNLLVHLDRVANPGSPGQGWTIRPASRPQRDFDIVAVMTARRSAGSDATVLLDRLRTSPVVAESRTTKKGHVHVRLNDAVVASRGERLEAGVPVPVDDVARGRRYLIHFCDPNASKALHLGHLRNVALGNALAAALRSAGAEVKTRSVVADFGRSIAEALAAAWPEDEQVEPFDPSTVNGDHEVSQLYARYVGSEAVSRQAATAGTADSPLAREAAMQGDRADALLARMMAAEPLAIASWARLRDVVVGGQLNTLARLGVKLDSTFFESELIESAVDLATGAAVKGLFAREEDGSIAYVAEDPNSSLTLLRPDGVPTQHLRTIAYWTMALSRGDGPRLVRIAGREWKPQTKQSRQLLPRLVAGKADPPVVLFHGMVKEGQHVIKSSRGNGMLIDDLLDSLAAEISEQGPGLKGDPVSSATVAARVALGVFLTQPMLTDVALDRRRFLWPERSLGWLLHLAHGTEAAAATGAQASFDSPTYRFAVVQAELLRVYLERVVTHHDLVSLARFAQRLAGWCASGLVEPATQRAMRTVLRQVAASLGLGGQVER